MNEHYEQKLKQALRQKSVMPYLTIILGPTKEQCPVHTKNKGLVLPVDDRYWTEFPMRETSACRCSIRQVSKYEYQKLKAEGVLEVPVGECKNICVSGILNLLKGNTECQYQTNLSISF